MKKQLGPPAQPTPDITSLEVLRQIVASNKRRAERTGFDTLVMTFSKADLLITEIDRLRLEVANADRALISAAPDLLEACEEFVLKVEAGEARSTNSYNQMKSAIKKARGEK